MSQNVFPSEKPHVNIPEGCNYSRDTCLTFIICPAPGHPFSNTGSGTLTLSSSSPLLDNLAPQTLLRDLWLINHEALLSRGDTGLEDTNQPDRPGVALLLVKSDRQTLLSEPVISTPLPRRKTALPVSER